MLLLRSVGGVGGGREYTHWRHVLWGNLGFTWGFLFVEDLQIEGIHEERVVSLFHGVSLRCNM